MDANLTRLNIDNCKVIFKMNYLPELVSST